MHTSKTPVGATGELEVYSGSTLSEPKVTPLEVTYRDRAGEVNHIVKYKGYQLEPQFSEVLKLKKLFIK